MVMRIGNVVCSLFMIANLYSQPMAYQSLLQAVERRDQMSVKKILEQKPDLVNPKENITTPLHIAAQNGDASMIELLLAYGANINAQNEQGKIPYDIAKETVARLIDGSNPLHWSIQLNNLSTLERDLAAKDDQGNLKYDVNQKKIVADQETPLHLATVLNKTEFVGRLLAAGADPNIQDASGNTPLHRAIFNKNLTIIRLLVAHRAQGDIRNQAGKSVVEYIQTQDADGNSFVHKAIQEQEQEWLQVLLELKANINAQNKEQITPLMMAIDLNNNAMVQRLLPYKPDLEVKDAHGKTALAHAVDKGNVLIIDMLIAAGADLHTQDNTGMTLLHHAIAGDSPKALTVLLEKGLDLATRNNRGLTPLLFAIERGADSKIIELLLQHGASIAYDSEVENTPLEYARLINRQAAADVLMRYQKTAVEVDITQDLDVLLQDLLALHAVV